jgi:hypothetical protein
MESLDQFLEELRRAVLSIEQADGAPLRDQPRLGVDPVAPRKYALLG